MTRRLTGLMFCIVLALMAMCGCVSAVELTVGTPNATVNDTVFEIPVILKNDIDFAGFTCEVGNVVNGATVTISDATPLTDFVYATDNGNGNSIQHIHAYSLGSTTDPELHLFTVVVNITDPTISSVPLNISMRYILQNDNTEYPLSSVTTSGLSSIKLRDGLTAEVTTEAEERLIEALMVSSPTAVPTTTDRSTASEYQGVSQSQILDSSSSSSSSSSISSSSSSSSSGSAPVPSASGSSSATGTKSSPGFGFVAVLSGLGIASTLLLKRKMH